MSHAFAHEAAHAVAAMDRAIRFEQVVISTPDEWGDAHGAVFNGVVLGGVHMVLSATSWVTQHPEAALEFALAGALAERGAVGHFLEGSCSGDLPWWRRGAVLTGVPRITKVVLALAGVEQDPERRLVDYADGPWTLTYEEIG